MDLIKQYTEVLDVYSKIALMLNNAISSLNILQEFIANVPAIVSPKHEVAFRQFIEDVAKVDICNCIKVLIQHNNDAYATCDNYKYALDKLKEQTEKENHLQKLRSNFQVGREYLIQWKFSTEQIKVINKFCYNDKLYVVIIPRFNVYEVRNNVDCESIFLSENWEDVEVYSKNLILTDKEKAGN